MINNYPYRSPEDEGSSKGVDKEKIKNAQSFKEQLQEALFATRDIAQESRKLAIDMGMASIEATAFRKAFKDVESISKKISTNYDEILEGLKETKDIQKDIDKSSRASLSVEREITQVLLQSGVAHKDITKGLQTEDGLTALLFKKHLNIKTSVVDAVRLAEEQLKNSKLNNKELKTQYDFTKDIENRMGLLGSTMEGITKIPLVGQFIDAREALSDIRKKASEVDSQGNLINGQFSVMATGIKSMGASIMKNMFDPLFLVTALFNSGFAYSKQTTQLANDLGVSDEKASSLRRNFSIISSESRNAALNSADMQEALNTLNDQFGSASTVLRDDIVSEMAKLGKLTNMSAEAQGRFAMHANISGKNAADITKETRRIIVNAESERGLRVDINKVMDQAGKIGGQISAQLGGNVTKIAKAVTVAKQFGMELEQVAKIGRSLLDFESSISNELEAELLIGKQLNLEKARMAALTGDYETLTREINANIGDFGDFTKMNILQQDALTKSVGMTSDELSNVLLKDKNIAQLAQEARDLGDEELAKQLEKRDAQQKFNDVLEKMKILFTDIVGGPVGGLLEGLGNILGKVAIVADFLGLGKGGIMDMVVGAMLLNKVFGGTLKALGRIGTALFANLGKVNATNIAEKAGLITKAGANNLIAARNISENVNLSTKTQQAALDKSSLWSAIKLNIQKNYAAGKDVAAVAMGGTKLGQSTATAVAESATATAKSAQNKTMIGMLAKGAGILAQSVGIAAAWAIANPIKALIGLGVAAAASAAIYSAMSKAPKKKLGGSIIGPSHESGGVDIEAEGGEYMISKEATSKIGTKNLETINTGKLPSNNVIQQSTTDNSKIEALLSKMLSSPGMRETKVDTQSAPTDLFANNTKIGKGVYQRENEGQVLFT